MKKPIKEVIRTKYDGYYIIKNKKDEYCAYEGLALCPDDIRTKIENKEIRVKELNCTHFEAISYGYV